MVTRKFADDDASLNTGSIIASRSRNYSDIDSTFAYNTNTRDVYLSKDAKAVKQAIRNLVLTEYGERPFKPFIGSGIRGLLFELADDLTNNILRDSIRRVLENFEPRAKIVNVEVDNKIDENTILARIEFQIITSREVTSVDVSLTRLR